MHFTTLNEYYRKKYGCKVYKLAIDAGFTCPNRDGTLDNRGCIFCSPYGGGEFAQGMCQSIALQLEKAKTLVEKKTGANPKYVAYFQSFTNTYGPVERLRQLYLAAMEPEYIVELSIGTRPDCLGQDVIALLEELNRRKPITVELGLQTIHEDTARWIRRGYATAVYDEAVGALKAAGIQVVTHLILGLPGETPEMAVASTRHALEAGTDGVKFHLLHVLRNTDLEQEFAQGRFRCLELEEYAHWLKECLSAVPDHVVVHRITGDGAKRDLVAPLWSADKKRVLNFLNTCLEKS